MSRLALVFATQPTIGMVRNGSAPPFFVAWMKASPSWPGLALA